jgi:NADPH:quinone reductase
MLMVWGADAERACVPETHAVEVPEDLDPAEVVSLVLPYVTAYQLLHRVAKVKSGGTVLVHGAAGRVGTAVLELVLAPSLCLPSRQRQGELALGRCLGLSRDRPEDAASLSSD